MSWLISGIKIIASFLGITEWFQRKAEREEAREQGRRDAALEAARKDAQEAREREVKREELSSLSDAELKRRMYPDD